MIFFFGERADVFSPSLPAPQPALERLQERPLQAPCESRGDHVSIPLGTGWRTDPGFFSHGRGVIAADVNDDEDQEGGDYDGGDDDANEEGGEEDEKNEGDDFDFESDPVLAAKYTEYQKTKWIVGFFFFFFCTYGFFAGNPKGLWRSRPRAPKVHYEGHDDQDAPDR